MTILLLLCFQDRVSDLIERLKSESLETRAAAEDELVAIGKEALPALKREFSDPEQKARARAAIERIEWGAGLRRLREKAAKLTSSARVFEVVREADSPYFPGCRLYKTYVSRQDPKLSSRVQPTFTILEPCGDAPFSGIEGLNALLRQHRVAVASEEEARKFAEFVQAFRGYPPRPMSLTSTSDGYEFRALFTLRVKEGRLEEVLIPGK